jgi:RNA polymerase sigma factor (sigma-70 family)
VELSGRHPLAASCTTVGGNRERRMPVDSQGSISQWLDGVKQGDTVAAQELWNRYFAQLVRVAMNRLRTLSRNETGEDVALSALKSAMIGMQENRYPEVADRNSLWPLLVIITARKAITEMRRQLARKRTITAEVHLSDVQEYLGVDPTPTFAIEVADMLEHLVLKFEDPMLRLIAQRRLEGWSHDEIAEEVGCSSRTVIRKLKRIRQEWEEGDNLDSQSE